MCRTEYAEICRKVHECMIESVEICWKEDDKVFGISEIVVNITVFIQLEDVLKRGEGVFVNYTIKRRRQPLLLN